MKQTDITKIKLNPSEYIVAGLILANFKDNNTYIAMTLNNNIRSNIPNFLKIGDTTARGVFKTLKDWKVINYTNVKGKCYHVWRGDNFEEFKQMLNETRD